MKHAHQTQFGRLATAVQNTDHVIDRNTDTASGMVDKWEILTALSTVAQIYGLNHRTLGVLKVLMTFLPERLITPDPRGAIVFPSNRTLSNRLNGMPDSTLRRHLAALVGAGIVSRHDSANRKRFARRIGGRRELAFGFDLSPLARQAAEITEHAAKAARHHERVAALRADVAQLRQQVLNQIGPHPLTDDAHLVLRRKPCEADLRDMHAQLDALLNPIGPREMSGADAQNERHIQYKDINNSDSETRVANDAEKKEVQHPDEPQPGKENTRAPEIHDVMEICTEYRTYFPEPARHWRDLAQIADRLTPMMGIDAQVFSDAIRQMGLTSAVTAVLCILERLPEIKNPGGYLRRLTQKAGAEGFDVRQMMNVIRPKGQIVT